MLQHHADLSVYDGDPLPGPFAIHGAIVPGTAVLYVADQLACDSISRLAGPGNTPRVGDLLPAVVVKVWDADTGQVNLKVLTDASSDYWATSRHYHPLVHNDARRRVVPGTWFFASELPLTRAPAPRTQAMDEASATGRTG